MTHVQSSIRPSDTPSEGFNVWKACMGRFLRRMSLAGQILLITAGCLVLTAGAALVAGPLRWDLRTVLSICGVISIMIVMAAVRRLLLDPLQRLDAHLACLMEGRLEACDAGAMPSRDLQR